MLTFGESGHPVFRGRRALARGPFESKGVGRTIHFNVDPTTAELLLRIIVSVNQLSIYGVIADWCQNLAQRIAAHSSLSTGYPVANVDNDPASQVPCRKTGLNPGS